MDRQAYVQLSASTRVYEKWLLSKETFGRLLEAPTMEEFQQILGEVGYGDFVDKLNHRDDMDDFLDHKIEVLFQDSYRRSPDPEVAEIFGAKYIFHNLKTVVKSYVTGQDLDSLFFDLPNADYKAMMEELKNRGSLDRLVPFSEEVNLGVEIFEKRQNAQKLDMYMDQLQYDFMLEKALALDSDLIVDFVKDHIDLQNLFMIFRALRQRGSIDFLEDYLIDGGFIPTDLLIENGSMGQRELWDAIRRYPAGKTYHRKEVELSLERELALLRKATADFLEELIKKGSAMTYGPEVVFSYLLRKEEEISKLRTITIGKMNGMTPEEIHERTGEFFA